MVAATFETADGDRQEQMIEYAFPTFRMAKWAGPTGMGRVWDENTPISRFRLSTIIYRRVSYTPETPNIKAQAFYVESHVERE